MWFDLLNNLVRAQTVDMSELWWKTTVKVGGSGEGEGVAENTCGGFQDLSLNQKELDLRFPGIHFSALQQPDVSLATEVTLPV